MIRPDPHYPRSIIQIRAAETKEFSKVHALLGRAFENVPPSFFRRRALTDPAFKSEQVRIAFLNGRMASTCRVVFRRIRVFDDESVLCGGIADVGTDPEFRGRGLAAQCIEDALRFAASKGAPISMLFARIQPFYARLGFFSVPMLDLRLNPRLGLPGRQAAEQVRCRNAKLSRDVGDLSKMHLQYRRDRTGSVKRNRTYWEKQMRFPNVDRDFFWTGVRGKKTVCYARGVPAREGLLVQEFGMARDRESELFSLLNLMAEQTNKTSIEVPFVHERERDLFKPYIRSIEENTRWMVRLLDLRRRDLLKAFFKPSEPLFWDSDRF
jgi:predicted acetyltransferase